MSYIVIVDRVQLQCRTFGTNRFEIKDAIFKIRYTVRTFIYDRKNGCCLV